MKKLFLLVFLGITSLSYSQKTKSDCVIESNFKEPERSKKMKKMAKRMNRFNEGAFPSLKEIKSHVSIDNDCDIKNVTLLRMEEQVGNGIYILCVEGTKMKYKRMGTVIMKNDKNPFDK
ncbi:conserved hypothetical protein [Tenacibaculum sp. 190130A14a]|uniref:hypothetical protein n=1 Tax=Tenacibaculum polynesiense TaxID=3137857 RepID=UPI00320406D1